MSSNYPNIVVFGQTGAGKSSLVNMLAGEEVAYVSNDPFGATPSNKSHSLKDPFIPRSNALVPKFMAKPLPQVPPSSEAGSSGSARPPPARKNTLKSNPHPETYIFWDTPGLNEDEKGTVRPQDAFAKLMDLAEGGVNLIVYCIRASRFTEAVKVNYDLFWGTICKQEVPIVLVVTGLEQEENMGNWWQRNEKDVQRMGLKFGGQACVTTTKGRNGIYTSEYEQSREEVWDLVRNHCDDKAWQMKEQRKEVLKKMEKYMKSYNGRNGQLDGLLSKFIGALRRRRKP